MPKPRQKTPGRQTRRPPGRRHERRTTSAPDRIPIQPQVLAAALAGTWRVDLRARQVTWGGDLQARLGVDPSTPQPLEAAWRLVHPDDRGRLQERLQRVEAGDESPWNETFRVLGANDTIAWRHTVGQPERDANGHLVAVQGVEFDVTEAKRIEASLEQSRQHEREAAEDLRRSHDQLHQRAEQLRRLTLDLALAEQEAREVLAKTVHDDLQQLLFSVKLRLDRMAALPPATARSSEDIDKARQDLDEAIAAARSLVVELFPPLYDGDLAAALQWLASWMYRKYGLTVIVTADRDATIDAHAQKSRRTLVFESVRELLFNVVKHAQVTRATVDLTLLPAEYLRVTIADEGVGFDPAALPSEPAEAGWGLRGIRERAELLGGSLQMTSAPGRGSRFQLTVPRSDSNSPWQPLRVLIADDHAAAREGLREILSDRPEFEIVGEATDGADAVALAETLRPDAIVMDVMMPVMDGVEATRRILAARPATRILGLSTQEQPAGPHAIEDAGAVAYFSKGDGVQALMDRLLVLHRDRWAAQASDR